MALVFGSPTVFEIDFAYTLSSLWNASRAVTINGLATGDLVGSDVSAAGATRLASISKLHMHSVAIPSDKVTGALEALKKNNLLVVFPEGERGSFKATRDAYSLRQFRTGFARMAAQVRTGTASAQLVADLTFAREMSRRTGVPHYVDVDTASSGVSPGRAVSTLTRSGAQSTVVLGNRLYCDSAVMRSVSYPERSTPFDA